MDGFSKKLLVHQIIWAALGGSMLIYGALPLLFPEISKNKGEFLSETLLFSIAGSLAGGSFLVNKFFIDPARLASMLKKLSTNKNNISPDELFLNILLVPNIVSWAMNESIAILGFINTVITGSHEKSIQIIVIAILMHVIAFPNSSKAKRVLEEVKIKMR